MVCWFMLCDIAVVIAMVKEVVGSRKSNIFVCMGETFLSPGKIFMNSKIKR